MRFASLNSKKWSAIGQSRYPEPAFPIVIFIEQADASHAYRSLHLRQLLPLANARTQQYLCPEQLESFAAPALAPVLANLQIDFSQT